MIADTYDSAMSPRPWKDALSNIEIFEYVVSESGSSFDPVAVDAFCKIHDAVQNLYQSDAMKEAAK